MSADKRKQNRIQGGVNQRGRGTPRFQRGTPRSRGQRTFGVNFQNQASPPLNEFSGTVLGSSRFPEEQLVGQSSSERTFFFEETNQEIREPPPVITEINTGETILSEGPTGISRIKFYPSFLDESYSECLFLTLLKSLKWEERYMDIRGEKIRMPRKMCWFGPMPYGFSGCLLEGQNEMPFEIESVLTQIKQATGLEFNSVLANLYENEHDSVAWHSDDELLMGVENTIASISLGEVRFFELRKKPPPEENGDFTFMQHYRFPLPNGSLLIMNGFMQQDWQHRLPKEYHSKKPRINLTFRTVFPRSEKTTRRTEDRKSVGNK